MAFPSLKQVKDPPTAVVLHMDGCCSTSLFTVPGLSSFWHDPLHHHLVAICSQVLQSISSTMPVFLVSKTSAKKSVCMELIKRFAAH